IAPGESYKYTSGAILDTPVGTMQGHYTLRNEFGTEFKAPINVFRLACPNILH
ncbi:ApaG domain, partial [Pseudoalteromonas sp. GW168-MNA-CIBAN-0100]